MTAGQAYQDMVYRGRKESRIGIRELKKLCKLCGPEDAKYAGLAVDWFQEKGYDFTEELNSVFVKTCVQGNQPEIAVKRFVYAKGRMGSWSTASSLNYLFGSLLEKGDAESMVNVLSTVVPKGVRPNVTTAELCLQACSQCQNRELYESALDICRRFVLVPSELENITQKHPIPAASNDAVKDDADNGEEDKTDA
eukprot:CAMPEP_0185017780 /NCGR_PEP_ID=MMETSP1103-20130426/676_1 /TAXON_ID=36769 /ORGANISM="Paraphysomonas bandaiensis, Strain Caron Lab Isolate" /LENGTH=194 /DNA_ID=CAMNT_0027547347 /DNA_START=198 /DNA_END=782 /DNA_ORIENTATION=-